MRTYSVACALGAYRVPQTGSRTSAQIEVAMQAALGVYGEASHSKHHIIADSETER